jgi:UDP:flavonoid glycosyltransferase YjiC (YdhE family)
MTTYGCYTVDVARILAELGRLKIEVVATLAGGTRAAVREIPQNTRIVPFVPLSDLAATCAVVIHHAGAATCATTTLHGRPQLAIPYHFDQPALAERLTRHHAGLMIHSAEATGERVRHDLLRLLDEPSFRVGAERIRDEMLAMPAPNEIVRELEELTAAHHS